MIVQAFAEYLKQFDDDIPTSILLFGWLKSKLSQKPECNITKVIQEEITLVSDEECNITFAGKSKTGIKLLESLYNFADSYEQQKFTRWVHSLKASDFGSFTK
ncbi:MAG: hypothetical protein A2104_02545 [Candidatus Melainabacteria bacterium GWF2_32_7]|nr:MAG: hypothetical protein A2104_02545 [Candidatus Melainabacteria bacterium GWF2_32_7]